MVLIPLALVLVMYISSSSGATLNACFMALLSEEFNVACSTLTRNHTQPCLVFSDEDVRALKLAKVIKRTMKVSRNRICAARTEAGEADCISAQLPLESPPNWQWTEWTGTAPNIARRFAVNMGTTNTMCPYEERYFVPEVYIDCLDALVHGIVTSGIYTISPDGETVLDVYCEQELEGGGWTVFQRRQNGEVNFYKTWAEYKAGFGDLSGDLWLGNQYIYLLTKSQDQKALFHLGSSDGQWAFAYYSEFWLADEAQKYQLHIGGYSGTAGDSMNIRHNGRAFTTKDQDNDGRPVGNCAITFKGAWWHDSCHYANLNGEYGNSAFGEGLNWYTWKGHNYSLKYTAIMVKRKTTA